MKMNMFNRIKEKLIDQAKQFQKDSQEAENLDQEESDAEFNNYEDGIASIQAATTSDELSGVLLDFYPEEEVPAMILDAAIEAGEIPRIKVRLFVNWERRKIIHTHHAEGTPEISHLISQGFVEVGTIRDFAAGGRFFWHPLFFTPKSKYIPNEKGTTPGQAE